MKRRLIAIDDDPGLLTAYQNVFAPEVSKAEIGIAALSAIFDNADVKIEQEHEFDIVCANSGEDGVALVRDAVANGKEFQVAIVDMRMPNGIDGLETAKRLRQIDENIQIVVVTAYTDKSPEEIRLSLKNGIYYFRKPFNTTEIYQLAFSLADNYKNLTALKNINLDLDKKVKAELAKNRDKDKQLAIQSKMAAMGEMISSIAHQWRQPLNGVSLSLQEINLRRNAICSGDTDAVWLQTSISNAHVELKKLSDTIDGFSALFKTNEAITQFDASAKIKEVVASLQPQIVKQGIKIGIGLGECNMNGYINEFAQVIVALMTNSLEALERKDAKDGFIKIRSQMIYGNIVVDIEDNAGGIPDDMKDRIFEPYFSVKHASHGVGLGLFVVKQMVEKNMNGKIMFQNTQNGTKFRVVMPANG